MKIAIYGAKSIALGVCKAVSEVYNDFEVVAFLVSSKENNPKTLAGLPVYELSEYTDQNIIILIATPEDLHRAIVENLEKNGFYNHVCIDSEKESELMEKYYDSIGQFKLLHRL